MTRSAGLLRLASLSILVSAIAPARGFSQPRCELNLAGTWQAERAGETSPFLYRFGSDASVAILSRSGPEPAPWHEVGHGTYTLDDPKAPKVIDLETSVEAGAVPRGRTSMTITAFGDTSFTSAGPGPTPTRWARVETDRHFIVLAGRRGRFYEGGGPAFAMLIRMAGQQTTVDAVGIDEAGGRPVFGAIPERTFRQFLQEPREASDVMLRLSISSAQYQRGLKILRTWDRRARERALLYPDVFMDNILLVKQVTEDLNRCGESVKLYTLDWGVEDDISEHNRPSNIPFAYFKELRRLNESRHVRDRDMPAAPPSAKSTPPDGKD